jgi:hypothetical protein
LTQATSRRRSALDGRDAQRRPCRLEAGPLKEVAAFAERYRRHWEESFDCLDEYLEIMKRKPAKSSAKKRSNRGNQLR